MSIGFLYQKWHQQKNFNTKITVLVLVLVLKKHIKGLMIFKRFWSITSLFSCMVLVPGLNFFRTYLLYTGLISDTRRRLCRIIIFQIQSQANLPKFRSESNFHGSIAKFWVPLFVKTAVLGNPAMRHSGCFAVHCRKYYVNFERVCTFYPRNSNNYNMQAHATFREICLKYNTGEKRESYVTHIIICYVIRKYTIQYYIILQLCFGVVNVSKLGTLGHWFSKPS